MKIIAINGYKRSGKNETAAAIRRNYPGRVKHLGFANKVKVFGARALGFDRNEEALIALMDEAKESWVIDLTDRVTPENIDAKRPQGPFHDLTGREYLQNIGTEARNLFGADFWVNQVLPTPQFKPEIPSDLRPKAERILNNYNLEARYPFADALVFSDLRFENEAERVLALYGEVWRVNRPGTESDGHASEQRLPDELVTRELYNVGSLVDLEVAVNACLTEGV